MLSTYDQDEYVYRAMRAGASGLLLNEVPSAELVRAVRTVLTGDALLAPVITRRPLEEYVRRPRPGARSQAPWSRLTKRETEVLRLFARGLANAEIAGQLVVEPSTVRPHAIGRVPRLLCQVPACWLGELPGVLGKSPLLAGNCAEAA